MIVLYVLCDGMCVCVCVCVFRHLFERETNELFITKIYQINTAWENAFVW